MTDYCETEVEITEINGSKSKTVTEEKCCANCAYCKEVINFGEYEGHCNKSEYFLKTIDDRLCKEFLWREE